MTSQPQLGEQGRAALTMLSLVTARVPAGRMADDFLFCMAFEISHRLKNMGEASAFSFALTMRESAAVILFRAHTGCTCTTRGYDVSHCSCGGDEQCLQCKITYGFTVVPVRYDRACQYHR
jgi:hypothetical protein